METETERSRTEPESRTEPIAPDDPLLIRSKPPLRRRRQRRVPPVEAAKGGASAGQCPSEASTGHPHAHPR
jgi:hypothetical protein